MIAIVGKWKTVQELDKLVGQKPTMCDIIGEYLDNGEQYSGLVAGIPYGRKVVVKHNGTTYLFSKRTNGRYQVESVV